MSMRFQPKNNVRHVKLHHQRGFALVSVLIVLLVLASMVGMFVRNQSASLKTTAIVLVAAQNEQNAHNQHRACLALIRNYLKGMLVGVQTGATFTQNLSNNPLLTVHNCTVSGAVLATDGATGVAAAGEWTPFLSITTVLNGVTETSEWQYIPCAQTADATCVKGHNQVTINLGGVNRTVRPAFLEYSAVQTAWRRESP